MELNWYVKQTSNYWFSTIAFRDRRKKNKYDFCTIESHFCSIYIDGVFFSLFENVCDCQWFESFSASAISSFFLFRVFPKLNTTMNGSCRADELIEYTHSWPLARAFILYQNCEVSELAMICETIHVGTNDDKYVRVGVAHTNSKKVVYDYLKCQQQFRINRILPCRFPRTTWCLSVCQNCSSTAQHNFWL